jgi:hypothetical protein
LIAPGADSISLASVFTSVAARWMLVRAL